MIREPIKILGINPGTRYIGYAVLYGQELMDWGIKVLEGKWSEKKINKAIEIVSDLIERYDPTILTIKKLHPARRTANLLKLANNIKNTARIRKIRIIQYSIKEIEKRFIEGAKLNKGNLIEAILKLCPAIGHDLVDEKSKKQKYLIRAFEAVALARNSFFCPRP